MPAEPAPAVSGPTVAAPPRPPVRAERPDPAEPPEVAATEVRSESPTAALAEPAPPGPAAPTPHRPRRRRTAVALTALGVVAAVLVAVVITVGQQAGSGANPFAAQAAGPTTGAGGTTVPPPLTPTQTTGPLASFLGRPCDLLSPEDRTRLGVVVELSSVLNDGARCSFLRDPDDVVGIIVYLGLDGSVELSLRSSSTARDRHLDRIEISGHPATRRSELDGGARECDVLVEFGPIEQMHVHALFDPSHPADCPDVVAVAQAAAAAKIA